MQGAAGHRIKPIRKPPQSQEPKTVFVSCSARYALTFKREDAMTGEYERPNERQGFEVGDEVIGDDHIRGIIVRTNDACKRAVDNHAVREYFVKDENGEKFLYTGESNLRLVKKGMGDAAPPRPEVLSELEEDLKHRPLAGLRS